MKKNTLFAVVSIILSIAVVVSFVQIHHLHQNLVTLQTTLDSLQQQVEEELIDQDSNIISAEASFKRLNVSKRKVEVVFTIIPKSSIANQELIIQIGEEQAILTRNDDVFTGTLWLDLFIEPETYPIFTIQTVTQNWDDKKVILDSKHESLKEFDLSNLFQLYLPSLKNVQFSNQSVKEKGNSSTDTNTITLSGELQVSFQQKATNSGICFKNYRIVGKTDVEVFSKDITSEVESAETFETGSYEGTIEETFEVNKTDNVIVYFVVEDSLGYEHKWIIWNRHNEEELPEGELIYSKNLLKYSK